MSHNNLNDNLCGGMGDYVNCLVLVKKLNSTDYHEIRINRISPNGNFINIGIDRGKEFWIGVDDFQMCYKIVDVLVSRISVDKQIRAQDLL